MAMLSGTEELVELLVTVANKCTDDRRVWSMTHGSSS
jgi:hypothetical protein